MVRPGPAQPPGGRATQRGASARIALAVLLLAFGVGDLAVISFVLVPLHVAERADRREAVVSHAPPVGSVARPAALPVPPPAAEPVHDAGPIDGGARDMRPTPSAPVAASAAAAEAPSAVAAPVPPEDFPDILFAINTTWLSRPSRETLDRLAEALTRNPDRRVVLSGHTDGAGDPVLNRALSRERAQKVARYLRGRGVEAARIEIRAFGSKQPVESGRPDELRPRNRRVEIAVQ
jgi:outer membrane protein OmpA-like peptidoglycan-associated protein